MLASIQNSSKVNETIHYVESIQSSAIASIAPSLEYSLATHAKGALSQRERQVEVSLCVWGSKQETKHSVISAGQVNSPVK